MYLLRQIYAKTLKVLNNQYKSSPTRGTLKPLDNWASLCGVYEIGLNWVKLHDPITPFLRQMPTFRKRGDSWRVEVFINGLRRSSTHKSKSAAQVWAAEQELTIRAGDRGEIPNKSFGDLLDRYADSVSVHKKGSKWELVRINLIKRDRIALVRLKDLDATHVSDWRDRRLQDVSGASVNREKNLLSHACTLAVKEWKWLKVNPFSGVGMPPRGKARVRTLKDFERESLSQFANTEIYKEVLRAADFALETGLRANELCQLEIHNIKGRVAEVEDNWTPKDKGKSAKGGYSRDVPLSTKAIELWGGKSFNLTPKTLDVHWRNLVKLAGIKDLQFRDTRATAATRLSKVLNPFQLAKMFGWKDLKIAMVYYRETAEDVAKLL